MESLKILADECSGLTGAEQAACETMRDKVPHGELDLLSILNWAWIAMGTVAVMGILFGAVTWVTSQGDPAKTKKGKDAVLYAVVGLLVVLLAASITNFVAGAIEGAKE